jgi:phage terminase small subunit
MPKNLTHKKAAMRRERFAREYAIDQNGTRAAIAAGYKKKSAGVTGSQLLKNPKVQELIAKFAQKTADKLEITADRVLQEIAKLAFVDPRKFFREDCSAIPINELDDQTAAALSGIEIFEEFDGRGEKREIIGYTKKFKFADKGENLERLGNYLQLFKNRIEISTSDPLEELLKEFRTRHANAAS